MIGAPPRCKASMTGHVQLSSELQQCPGVDRVGVGRTAARPMNHEAREMIILLEVVSISKQLSTGT